MTDAQGNITAVAKAICAEQCAVFGEPPCHQIGPWPNENCNEPGCVALATAALASIAELRATSVFKMVWDDKARALVAAEGTK
jgi:hypothetical protein